MSLANKTTVVADVSCPLAAFITAWVTTPSGYDALFAAEMRDDWARRHRPVLSTREGGHVLYTGYHITEPNGQLVHCHRQCGIENRTHNTTGHRGNQVKITCRKCQSYCTIDRATLDSSTPLGSRRLVKTVYPPEQVATTWMFKDPKIKATTPMMKVSPNPIPAFTSPALTPSVTSPAPTPVLTLPTPIPALASPTPIPVPTPSILVSSMHSMPMDQGITSQAMLLLEPPSILTHSTSLPVASSSSGPHQLGGLLQQRPTSPVNQLSKPMDTFPVPTSTPNIKSRSMVSSTDTSLSRLKITIPAHRGPSNIIQPPSTTSPITRSLSTPQMDAQQQTLKRPLDYPPLMLSTSAPQYKRQRSSKK